jgi:hypothetical protein
MNWYVASLLFESIHSTASSDEALWEERFILLAAPDEQVAKLMAIKAGHEGQVTYEGEKGDQITWTFRAVERVHRVESDDLQSGVDIFSRFLKAAEAKSLLTKFS